MERLGDGFVLAAREIAIRRCTEDARLSYTCKHVMISDEVQNWSYREYDIMTEDPCPSFIASASVPPFLNRVTKLPMVFDLGRCSVSTENKIYKNFETREINFVQKWNPLQKFQRPMLTTHRKHARGKFYKAPPNGKRKEKTWKKTKTHTKQLHNKS